MNGTRTAGQSGEDVLKAGNDTVRRTESPVMTAEDDTGMQSGLAGMISWLGHHVSVALYCMKLTAQRQLEYPSFLVCWLIGNPLQYITGLWMFHALTLRFDSVAGWRYPELAFMYGLSLISHGLMVIFFIQTWNIERMVIRGQFDRLLVRPMNVYYQFIVQYFNFIGFLDLIPGLIIFAYGASASGFVWSLANVVRLLLVLVGATLIRVAVYTINGSLAFWTKGGSSLNGMTGNLLDKIGQFPLSVYPKVLQMVFTFLLPFGFISFYPASVFLGREPDIELPMDGTLLVPLIGLLLMTFATTLFNRGMKRYESAGS